MSLEMAIWRMTDSGPVPLATKSLDLEKRLEDMVVADPALTGMDLLVVARQVRTDFGGSLDILAIDEEAHLHVLELKRGRTPRDVVAQALDYASWVQSLTLEQVSAIYAEQHDGLFDDAFADRFGVPVPDLFNSDQQLTIVASELDAASDRIVSYLAEQYNVPINAVFFRHFVDSEAEYLARTWLIPPEEGRRPAVACSEHGEGASLERAGLLRCPWERSEWSPPMDDRPGLWVRRSRWRSVVHEAPSKPDSRQASLRLCRWSGVRRRC